jgi:hypothetical protein
MAGSLLIRMKFDRQEGNNYYFLAGFYDSGMNLDSYGTGAFPIQHSILNVLTAIPSTLSLGQQIGTYTVPVPLFLKGAKGRPWIWETDLIPDLLTNWFDIIGYLYLDWYEVLYQPAEEPALPSPYAEKFPAALTHPSIPGAYNLPLLPSQWPSDTSEYRTQTVADTVSQEGCQLMTEYAFCWGGTIDPKWHMLSLIDNGPILPEEPNIDVRWRESHAQSNMKRAWGSYDTRYPQYEFDGWNSPLSGNPEFGKIRILEGLDSVVGDLIITGSTGIIIPYLSNSKSGDQVTIQIPFVLESTPSEDNEAFIFPDAAPITEEPFDFTGIFVGLPILLDAINLKGCYMSSQGLVRRFGRVSARNKPYLAGDSTTGLLGDSTVGLIGGKTI